MKNLMNLLLAVLVIFGLSAAALAAGDDAPVTVYNPRAVYNFELYTAGSTGYAVIDLAVKDSDGGKKIGSIPAGTMFTILDEAGTDFKVQFVDGSTGYVIISEL